MFCIHCGAQIPDEAKFCPNCGKFLTENNSQNINNTVHTPPTQTVIHPVYQNPNEPVRPIYTNQEPSSQVYNVNPNYPQYPYQPIKKKKSGCLIAFIVTFAVFAVALLGIFMFIMSLSLSDISEEVSDASYSSEDTSTESADASAYVGTNLELDDVREFHTTYMGDGEDINTVMIYMIGSDLESDAGYASMDIDEMLEADLGENVNVIIMTGGASSWTNPKISNKTCQYWQVSDGELVSINTDVGKLCMTDGDTLSQFIVDASILFPANRYSLIMWDHGGGTLCGFGYDEHFPDDALTLEETATALSNAEQTFDFIGYDACLMGTVEIAVALEPYADYLIASEELEEACGWYYTDWLTALGDDPSMGTVDLAKILIDTFIDSHIFWQSGTLSVTELRQIPYAYQEMCNYFSGARESLRNNSYSEISIARSNSKAFGESDFDQIDAIDFILKSDLDGAEDTVLALSNAIKYSNSTRNIDGANGLSMYFPYDYPEDYTKVQEDMESVGYSGEYMDFFSDFVSIMTGVQLSTSNNTTHDYSDEDWYDSDIAESYQDSYQMNEYEELVIDEKGDSFVLSLSDEQWSNITKIEQNVLLDDETGYQFLGTDNAYEFDEDGDLIVEFDYTWIAIDGNIVPFYAEVEETTNDGKWYTYGAVDAVLNDGDIVQVILYWDDENPYGYVAGYRKYTDPLTPSAKGLFDLEEGDKLEWVFDFYTYEFDYDGYYIVGDPYIVDDEMTVSYEYVNEDYDSIVYFTITDIYNNQFVTEAVIYSDY